MRKLEYYRERALECLEMSRGAPRATAARLQSLSQQWLRLADFTTSDREPAAEAVESEKNLKTGKVALSDLNN